MLQEWRSHRKFIIAPGQVGGGGREWQLKSPQAEGHRFRPRCLQEQVEKVLPKVTPLLIASKSDHCKEELPLVGLGFIVSVIGHGLLVMGLEPDRHWLLSRDAVGAP